MKKNKDREKPLVSVITIAYNEEKYIREAIESILKQNFLDLEYIIIDDGSTDNTPDIIKEYSDKFRFIKTFSNNTNQGIPKSRNLGIKIANGKYILWQDADDISMPDRIKVQVEYMDENSNVGICGGNVQFFKNGKDTNKRLYSNDDKIIRKKIFLYSPVAQPACIVRKKALEEVGVFNPSLSSAEDLDLSFRIGTKYQFGNVPEIVIKYRIHDQSVTFRQLKTTEKNTIKIRRSYFNNKAYHPSIVDKLYNYIQLWTIYLMPPKWRIGLFQFIRNTK